MTGNVFNKVNKYLKDLKVAYHDTLSAPYIISMYCHHLNLHNKSAPFLYAHGKPMDLRLHTFMVAPPGMGKSLFIELFLDNNKRSVLQDTQLDNVFVSTLTEAGLIGTVRLKDDEVIEQKGLAYKERNSIIGCEEFDALATAMQQKHSSNLDNALLLALDSGRVRKDLAGGSMQYNTNFTLYAASQPERFNLASGLARRFLFIYFVPTMNQLKHIKKMRRESRNIQLEPGKIIDLKQRVNDSLNELSTIKKVQYPDGFDEFLDSLDIPHFEEPQIEKYCMGYAASTGNHDNNTLYVEIDTELKDQIAMLSDWRKSVKSGASTNQVLAVIKGQKRILYNELLDILTDYGLSYQVSATLIETLKKSGKVKTKKAGNDIMVEVK